MSLINNVLKDLDNRRNGGASASSGLGLIPASEPPDEQNRHWLIYVTVALSIVAAGLGYWWLQTDTSQVRRQLDIQVATPAPDPAVQEGIVPEAIAQTRASNIAISASETSESLARSASEQPPVAEVPVGVPALQTQPPAPRAPTGPELAARAEPVGQLQAEADPRQTEATAPTASLAQTIATKGESAGPVAAPEQQNAIDKTGDNGSAVDSVKNDGELTAEEWDLKTVQDALRLIANNDVPTAYAMLEQQVRDNRYAYQSRETYAKLLINDGEYSAGYRVIEAGLALAPNHAGFKKLKARILIANGQITEAAALLSSRAPAISTDPEYHDLLATAQLAGRDYEGALISYTGLLRQDRGHGKWWYGFGAAHDALGNSNAARQAYSQAVQQADLSPNLRRRSQERLAALSP